MHGSLFLLKRFLFGGVSGRYGAAGANGLREFLNIKTVVFGSGSHLARRVQLV